MGHLKGVCRIMGNAERNTYVKGCIKKAVIKLLEQKELEKISVSEITKMAQVSRSSFYRNYHSVEEILSDHIRELLITWDAEYKASGKDSNAELYGSFFAHLKEHQDIYLLLGKRKLSHIFQNAYLELYGPKPENTNVEAYVMAFIAFGTFGWIEEWIRRGMEESAETMAAMLAANGMT